ncbi:MAG: SUF system Fe-S cluster assembly protein [Phycisphaeraceae bacterium]
MPNTEFRIGGDPVPDMNQPDQPDRAPSEGEDQSSDQPQTLEEKIVAAMREVYDPEIPLNIYDLGLIYDVDIDDEKNVHITMTLTSPACPVAGELPGEVRESVERVEETNKVTIELTFDPPWSPELLSDEAKLTLGLL